MIPWSAYWIICEQVSNFSHSFHELNFWLLHTVHRALTVFTATTSQTLHYGISGLRLCSNTRWWREWKSYYAGRKIIPPMAASKYGFHPFHRDRLAVGNHRSYQNQSRRNKPQYYRQAPFPDLHQGAHTDMSLDDSSQVVWMRYGWWSKYSTNDHLNITATREVDRAWDDIVPGHGVVAIDHQWAADQGLPLSMNLPDDHSKGVYILDAYHQIHCLVGEIFHCWTFETNQ